MCVCLSLIKCSCEILKRRRAIVEARVEVQALDLSFTEVGASFGGKKLKAFLTFLDLCIMDHF